MIKARTLGWISLRRNYLEIRTIRPDELELYAQLEQAAFVAGQDAIERYTEQIYRPERENIYGLFENGELLTTLAIIYPEIWLGAGTVKMPGIAGVATPPHARRNGYLKILLNQVLDELHAKGYAISTLHPFNFPFYKKFGYELFSTAKEVKVKLRAMQTFLKQTQAKGYWKAVKPDEWQTLDAIYNEFCKGKFGRLTRDQNWWNVRVFNNWKDQAHTAYVWQDESGRNRAYILYSFNKLAGSWQHELHIRDQAWLDPQARLELLAFVANHDSQTTTVVWQAEEHDEIFALLADPREAEEKIYPGYMLRILDAVRALGERPWYSATNGTFTLALRDDRLERNNNLTLQVVVKNGQAAVESVPGLAKAGLVCDIRQLSQLYAGYRSPQQLAALGLLEVRNQKDLEEAQRAFYYPGQRVPFLSDGF